ncbi:MAG: pyroglutamyl-peptidase I [Luteococcus japonicus]
MRLLVTAFDPFGGEPVNPALEAVRRLPAEIAGAEVVTLQVPTVFGRSIDVVTAAIDELRPDAVICVGQAGGHPDVTPERVAINVDDARIPDNEGNQPLDRSVADDGPAAYFATLPVKAMVQAIRDEGLPSSLSNTAGTFVCNHLMYGVLHHLAVGGRSEVRAGFVHVPFIPEQVAGRPELASLPLAGITRALECAVEAVVQHEEDIQLVAGTTH